MKKIPMRRCVATGESCPKKELLRIVRTPEGTVEIDLGGKRNGKGAYIKKDLKALELAKQKKALSRALEVEIPESVYAEIAKILSE